MKRLLVALIAPLCITAGCQRAEPATDPQALQLTRLADKPAGEMDDSLFILWEYGGALREQALAELVLRRTRDPEVRALATLVRDGHQAGMDAMRKPSQALGLTLPTKPTELELAAISGLSNMPPDRLDAFFLRRQRAMHAWDITVFDDYLSVASNPDLKAYVGAVRQPLRDHSAIVDALARKKGLLATDEAARPSGAKS